MHALEISHLYLDLKVAGNSSIMSSAGKNSCNTSNNSISRSIINLFRIKIKRQGRKVFSMIVFPCAFVSGVIQSSLLLSFLGIKIAADDLVASPPSLLKRLKVSEELDNYIRLVRLMGCKILLKQF